MNKIVQQFTKISIIAALAIMITLTPSPAHGDAAKAGLVKVKKKSNQIDAAMTWGTKWAYFFVGKYYLRYETGGKIQKAKPITVWKGLQGKWSYQLDAALNYGGGKYYFFKGKHYVRLWKGKYAKPRLISDGWKGLTGDFSHNLDAACTWGTDYVYFFKGKHYISYIKSKNKFSKPKLISKGWKGLTGEFSSDIDGAYNYNGKVYFFKGEKYRRYWKGKYAPAKSITKNWLKIPTVEKTLWVKPQKPTFPESPTMASQSEVLIGGTKCYLGVIPHKKGFNRREVWTAVTHHLRRNAGRTPSHEQGKFWKDLSVGSTIVIYWSNQDSKKLDWIVVRNGGKFFLVMTKDGKIARLHDGQEKVSEGAALGVNFKLRVFNPKDEKYWKKNHLVFSISAR